MLTNVVDLSWTKKEKRKHCVGEDGVLPLFLYQAHPSVDDIDILLGGAEIESAVGRSELKETTPLNDKDNRDVKDNVHR